MTTSNEESEQFPDIGALFQELAEALKGWAKALGTEASYHDDRVEEGGSNAWGGRLQDATRGDMKTTVSLMTARGRVDAATDLRQRFEDLYVQGQGYQQRLEALEDQRRVHVEGLVSQYRRKFDDDPDQARLRSRCKGPQRIWTLGAGENPPETVEEFAEAIDKAFWDEQGGKLRARAEMQRTALDLAEHIELLAAIEAQQHAEAQRAAAPAQETGRDASKRGKRGPARMSMQEAWRYLTVVQEWTTIQESNRPRPLRDRVQKVQLAAKHDITVKELDAMLAWYAKHHRYGRFPEDPRTLSRDELEKLFE